MENFILRAVYLQVWTSKENYQEQLFTKYTESNQND